MTRAAYKALGLQVQAAVDGKTARPHVGTWMDRPGVSIEIGLTTAPAGRRLVVHKWDDQTTCVVNYIEGDFWRKPEAARRLGRTAGVEFTAEAIIAAATELLAETRP